MDEQTNFDRQPGVRKEERFDKRQIAVMSTAGVLLLVLGVALGFVIDSMQSEEPEQNVIAEEEQQDSEGQEEAGEVFNPANIYTAETFVWQEESGDGEGEARRVVFIVEDEGTVYLTDENLRKESAVKLIGGPEFGYEFAPFIHVEGWVVGEGFIAIGIPQVDAGDVAIFDVNGAVVFESVRARLHEQNSRLGNIIGFERWERSAGGGKSVWLTANHFADQEPQHLVRISLPNGTIQETVPFLRNTFPYEYYTE
ncbi:MAG: hypothetical protein WD850_00075 [Candidatus Spechtbacterales bacterium]